jgi:polyisoprenoid-binding protein YceI
MKTGEGEKRMGSKSFGRFVRRNCVAWGLALSVGLLASVAVTSSAVAEEPPGEITFVAKNSIVTANGTFDAWRFSEIERKEGGLGVESAVVTVDLASVDTGSGRRDKHLRTADFFDVERFPTAIGKIHDITAGHASETLYTATLDLDLHGVQKSYIVSFDVVKTEPLEVRGSLEIDLRDFGIGKPKSFNPLSIKNEVTVSFSAKMPD